MIIRISEVVCHLTSMTPVYTCRFSTISGIKNYKMNSIYIQQIGLIPLSLVDCRKRSSYAAEADFCTMTRASTKPYSDLDNQILNEFWSSST